VLMMIMEAQGVPLIKGSSRQVGGSPIRHDIWAINATNEENLAVIIFGPQTQHIHE